MGVQRLNTLAFLMFIGIAALQMQSSNAQKTHTVGGINGTWSVPQNATFYGTWAASETFAVGDSLLFNFPTGNHTVAYVTKTAFDSCTTTNPISVSTTSPVTVKLNSTGNFHFICQVTGHCSYGQKVAVTVGSSTSPPPKSASSFIDAAAALPVTFMSIAVASFF